MVKRIVWVFPAVAILIACAPGTSATPSTPSGDKVVFTGDLKADWAQIVALEDSAKALVDSTGCTSAAECRTAPVGSRACGGPRYYLVYCSRTTDSAALYRKLEAVANAERDYNIHYKLASTCEFRMPPTVGLTGSSCVAK